MCGYDADALETGAWTTGLDANGADGAATAGREDAWTPGLGRAGGGVSAALIQPSWTPGREDAWTPEPEDGSAVTRFCAADVASAAAAATSAEKSPEKSPVAWEKKGLRPIGSLAPLPSTPHTTKTEDNQDIRQQ